jgi:hypothetical protein
VVANVTRLRPSGSASSRDRHVADRHLVRGHDRREVEGRLVARLVEHRREAARVGRLELGEQPAHGLAGALVGVIEREQPGRLGLDLAGVRKIDAVGAGHDRRGGLEPDGLGLLVHLGLKRARASGAVGTQQARRRER